MAKQSKAKKLTPGVPAQGGAQTAKKPRGSGAVKLALMLVLLVALVAGVIAGSTTWATATARAETAGKAIDKILNGSNRALSILQRQRYLRLNLISRIFRTDQVLTSYLVAAAQARDEAAILASVEEYQDLLTFDLAVVLDRNGVVLTRTDDRSASGEDLAATPLVAVALEESKASGVWQQNDQLYNALAEPLVRQFELVGYIAVAYSINNTLAADIKRTGGAEIVFLAESGVGPAPVASTLDDGMSQELVEALRKQGDVLGLVMEEGDVVDRVELEFGGEKWTASLAPLRDAAGGSVGAAIALTSLGDTRQSFNNIQKATLVAGGLSLLVGAILAFALAKWVYRPFTRLADAVTQGVQGHWDVQMPTGSGDAKRISEAVRDLFTQLREKAAVEFVVGRVSRLLPEPAKESAQGVAKAQHLCVVGVEMRRYADPKVGYDAEENMARLDRDVQKISTSTRTQKGEVVSMFGHRVLLSFEGEHCTWRALCAATEIMLTLSERDSVFDEPSPPVVALSSGPMINGTISSGLAVAGVPVQILESLMREASPGGLYFSKQVYAELGELFQRAQVQVKGQRGILSPQPLYLVDAESASRMTGVQALTDGGDGGEGRGLSDLRRGVLLAGRFDMLDELGAGRMGIVWKAQDRDLGDLVSLKMLRPEVMQDAALFERLKRAVAKARSIRHPNVLSVLDFGEAERLPYIEMEFARGFTLAYLLEQARQVPVVAGVRFAREIARGLAAAHNQQLMHSGLKPENILIDTLGLVKVMDFGLGMPVRAGAAVEAPGYLAPEQLEAREPDSRADFFSFGAVVYSMLTGKLPYPGSTSDEIRRKMAEGGPEVPTSLVAEIPPKLEEILLKCLQITPDQRYASADELVADLEDISI